MEEDSNTNIILVLNIILIIGLVLMVFSIKKLEKWRDDLCIAKKPIIYIYPEVETEVTVKLKKPEKLLVSYPEYKKEWKVLAKQNGELEDLETKRKLYGLYWEGKIEEDKKININEGFVVEGKDVSKFLEEKLSKLGLNEREAEEFIIYWLPKMKDNKYNYVRFETIEDIDEEMPLEITPVPDTIIRILMEFKPLDKKIEVKEQEIKTPERKGYTVVEWGGTEIK